MGRVSIAMLAFALNAPDAFAQARVDPRIYIQTDEPFGEHPADPALLRAADLHPGAAVKVPGSFYPTRALRARSIGEVKVEILVGVDDRILECRVTQPAASADLTATACPLVRSHASFRHALAIDGAPRQIRIRMEVHFDLVQHNPEDPKGPVVYAPPAAIQADPDNKARVPEVLDPEMLVIRGAPIGMFLEANPMVELTLDSNGIVTRCSIFISSGTDAGDLLMCRTVSAARFHPRLDQNGRPVAGPWGTMPELRP